ncbi:hypothetical protein [Marinagarivorans algicola]|uniref:hypothetical protein n=1 Tax=Marinagarivorans algicola TaxID=1513270 RepID=UPI003734DAF7
MSKQTLAYDRLAVLREACIDWAVKPNWSKANIGWEVFEGVREWYSNAQLDVLGIQLPKNSSDTALALKNAGQKLFRWLGADEVPASPAKVFFIEHVIVSVMPSCIRLNYINTLYGNHLCFSHLVRTATEEGLENLLMPFAKEVTEALQAMVAAQQKNVRLEDIGGFVLELRESVAMHEAAIAALEKLGRNGVGN